jgi:hypothetical protein
LASLLATQGPKTSKFEIDAKAPGAEILAQKIAAKQFSGMVVSLGWICKTCFSRLPDEEQQRRKDLLGE